MKFVTLAAFAAGALVTLTTPSLGAAQPYDHHDRRPGADGPATPGGWDLDRRMEWLQQRISRGRADGSLDRREAWRAQRSLDNIKDEARRMRMRHHGWLGGADRDALQARLDRLNDRLRWQRHNDERRPW
jgi:hypothetical protein